MFGHKICAVLEPTLWNCKLTTQKAYPVDCATFCNWKMVKEEILSPSLRAQAPVIFQVRPKSKKQMREHWEHWDRKIVVPSGIVIYESCAWTCDGVYSIYARKDNIFSSDEPDWPVSLYFPILRRDKSFNAFSSHLPSLPYRPPVWRRSTTFWVKCLGY